VSYLKDPSTRKPPPDVVAERRERFERLSAFVTRHDAWIILTPGAKEIIIECLPGSGLLNLLADRGYDLKPEQDGERILPLAVSQGMTRNADGALSSLIEGSTHAVTATFNAPGIVWTRRWSFHIP
jgi:hypothetical protein